jgi:hypothetical protein
MRQHEAQGRHDMRRDAQEHLALLQGFRNQAKPELLQVA